MMVVPVMPVHFDRDVPVCMHILVRPVGMQVVYFALFSLVCEHDAGRDAGHVMMIKILKITFSWGRSNVTSCPGNAPEPVAYRYIFPTPLQQRWNNASVRHRPRCFAS